MRVKAFLERAVPWRWALYWLLIPNLIVILMWPIGGPSMAYVIQLFGFAALLVSQLPWTRVKQLLLLAMMALVTTHYVCRMFNLQIWAIRYLPSLASEVQPWRAPLYVAGVVVFLGAVVVSLRWAPRVKRFPSFLSMLVALGMIFGFSMIDKVATASTRESYRAEPQPGDPFNAASHVAGLAVPAAVAKRHVVIILVEALGHPIGETEKALYAAAWDRPHWRERYEVLRGDVPYYGSTTSAELRELCGVWGLYTSFDFAKADCLPELYRKAGYQTTAMHSFSGSFFDRETWYPMLHFDRVEFARELKREGISACGGMFPGACDKDVPALLGRRLAAADRPQMIYWLTLNTHAPVAEDATLGTVGCRFGPRAWSDANPGLCRMFVLHHQLADAIDAMAMDPRLPPTDILIVGDHMPPSVNRETRLRFDGRHVPWLLLRGRP